MKFGGRPKNRIIRFAESKSAPVTFDIPIFLGGVRGDGAKQFLGGGRGGKPREIGSKGGAPGSLFSFMIYH